MKRIILSTAAFFLSAFFYLIIPQDLNEVVDYHFDAMNQDKYNKIQTITITSEIIAGNEKGTLQIFYKRPNKMRVEKTIKGKTTVTVFDGENGWIKYSDSKSVQKMNKKDLENYRFKADLDGYFYCYREKNHDLKLLGKEKLDGKEYYKILCTMPNGEITNLFLDTKTYLLNRTEQRAGDTEVVTVLSNYKKVNDIPFPFKFEIKQNGNTEVQNVKKIKLDANVGDEIFVSENK